MMIKAIRTRLEYIIKYKKKNLPFLILFLSPFLSYYNPLYGQVDTAQSGEWKKNIEDKLKSVGISPADSLIWCDADSCSFKNLLFQKEMVDFVNSVCTLDVFFLSLSPHGIKGDFLIRLTIQSSFLQVKVITRNGVYIVKEDSSLMVVFRNLSDNIVEGNFVKVGYDYHDDAQVYWIKKEGVKKFSFHTMDAMMEGFDNESKEALGSNYKIFELMMGFYDKVLGR